MKKLIAMAVLTVAVGLAGDVKGTWKGQVNRPDGAKETDVVLQLAQDGDSVTGKVGTHSDDMIPVRNAKLEGARLTFEVAGDEVTYKVALDLEGETMKGGVVRTRDGQSSPPLPIELRRASSE
jgi:hypothetical protein